MYYIFFSETTNFHSQVNREWVLGTRWTDEAFDNERVGVALSETL